MGNPSYKRRIMIVDREFQFRFIRRIVLLATLIVASSLSLLAICYYVSLDIQTAIVQPLPLAVGENVPMIGESATILSVLFPVIVVSIAVTLAVTLVFGIIMSHRMAGPLFRIQRELKKMAQGDLSGQVRLRKKDDFKSLAHAVNSLKSHWRDRIEELNGVVAELDAHPVPEQAAMLVRLKKIVSSFTMDADRS